MDAALRNGTLNGKGGVKMENKNIKDIMLLQTNNMTFGQFEVTPIQDNILTIINEHLQGYMENKKPLNLDLFGYPYFTINCDDIGGPRHKMLVIKNVVALFPKVFSYRWFPKEIIPLLPKEFIDKWFPNVKGHSVKTTGTIISTFHDIEGTNLIEIVLNPWAIPFLTYYGKGVGGTWYKKQIALSLRGDKPKRIYKILCSQCNNERGGVFDYPIKQLIEDFQLPPSYTNTIIKNRILEPAKNEINGIFADVWFEYELKILHPLKNKRKPKADTVRFYIHTTRKEKETHHLSTKTYKGLDDVLYRWLIATFGCVELTDKVFNTIMESDRRDEIINRVVYWQEEQRKGEKTSQHIKNCIKKLVREDFNLDV